MAGDKPNLVRYIHITIPLSKKEAIEITDRFKEKTIPKFDILLIEEKICNEFHFMDRGFVRSYT